MWLRSWIILVLVVLLSSSYVAFGPVTVDAVGQPIVTIEFDEGEEQQTAEVSPGNNAVVVFPGTVNVYMMAGSELQDVEVELLGSVEQGWPVTMNPTQLTMSHGDNESFTATVVVPEDANSDMPAVLEVTAIAKTYPGALIYRNEPINGTIFVTQYFGFSVNSKESLKEADTGDSVKYSLNVNNNGNGRDVFLAGIVNIKELNEDGLATTLDRTELEIGGKETGWVNLSVAISEDERSVGTHSIRVEVKSENGRSEPVSFTFTLRVSRAPEPDDVDPPDIDPPDGPDTPEFPDEPETPETPDDKQDEPDSAPSGTVDADTGDGPSYDLGWIAAIIVVAVVILGIGLLVTFRNNKW